MDNNVRHRLEWIDWMKFIGMYFIIAGHFFPVFDLYIYVFNVPLFFIISGFLSKKEPDSRLFWRKIWFNLIGPTLLIALLNYIISLIIGTFDIKDVCYVVRDGLLGFQYVYGACWFIVSLAILRIIHQYSGRKCFLLFIPLFLFLSYAYNHIDFEEISTFLGRPNSVFNVCSAYPFYAFGALIKTHKSIIEHISNIKLFLLFLIGFALVCLCGNSNGYVWLYRCGYGRDLLLFLIGGISGTCCIFAIAKALGKASKSVLEISAGTVVVLGFHQHVISLIRTYIQPSPFDYVFAFIILLLFIPIIAVVQKYCPFLLGKYRAKSLTDVSSNRL